MNLRSNEPSEQWTFGTLGSPPNIEQQIDDALGRNKKMTFVQPIKTPANVASNHPYTTTAISPQLLPRIVTQSPVPGVNPEPMHDSVPLITTQLQNTRATAAGSVELLTTQPTNIGVTDTQNE